MKQRTIQNDYLEVIIKHHGAEMCSLKNLATGMEYLWNADPKFWGRTSPILFPFVGSLKNKTYRYDGNEYQLGQHGFARDMDFKIISQEQQEVWFELSENEDTYKVYPFKFQFKIGYRLEEQSVRIMWKVKNTDTKEMYFSIGAHPAFNCPLHNGDKQADYSIKFMKKDGSVLEKFLSTDLGQGGCVVDTATEYEVKEGLLPITDHLFDIDTLILENSQVQRVSLLNSAQKEYLAVEFDAPVVGIWSPPGKQAPFICIEPWYGRGDNESFTGELQEREWSNKLEVGEEFFADYRICIY